MHSLYTFLLSLTPLLASASTCPDYNTIKSDLGSTLSPGSSIDNSAANAPRWSLFAAPTPAYVVNVASEADVALAIEYSNKNGLQFLAQSRGNGWADTFNLGSCGVIINIIALNSITFNDNKTLATIGGGALSDDIVQAAYGNNTRVATPTCPCLGYLGASLGGGLTREMGLYGAGVDQIVSVNLVLANGTSVFVDATHNTDLWFAVRGAVSNFGIVTSAVIKAYPQTPGQNSAWQGLIQVPDSQLGNMISAIHALDLAENMEIDLLIGTSGPPSYTPGVTIVPIFFGTEADAKTAFSNVLSLVPAAFNGSSNDASDPATPQVLPYSKCSDWAVSFCQKGLRKNTWGTSTTKQSFANAQPWQDVYDLYKQFIAAHPEAANSSVLAEYYPVQRSVAIGQQAGSVPVSYPWRDRSLHTVFIPIYANASLDADASAFGSKARDILRASDPTSDNSTYINFAHGDETNTQIYGSSLSRLQQLKSQYDPKNVFNQWFQIQQPTT